MNRHTRHKARVGGAAVCRVAMLGFPDAQILDIAGPLEVFARASRWLTDEGLVKAPVYEITLVAATPGSLAMSNGLRFVVEKSIERLDTALDTLMVAGGLGVTAAMSDPRLLAWLRKIAPRVRRRLCGLPVVAQTTGRRNGSRSLEARTAAGRTIARSRPGKDQPSWLLQ